MVSHVDHIREIESVGLGAATIRDATVVQSWLRCINKHRLDPAQACEAYIVPDTQLREHRQQSEELIAIARSGLESLFRQVATMGRRDRNQRVQGRADEIITSVTGNLNGQAGESR